MVGAGSGQKQGGPSGSQGQALGLSPARNNGTNSQGSPGTLLSRQTLGGQDQGHKRMDFYFHSLDHNQGP